VEAEAAGRQDALRRAAAALQDAEATARLAVTLRAELDELVETAAHLEAELVAAQVRATCGYSRTSFEGPSLRGSSDNLDNLRLLCRYTTNRARRRNGRLYE
jgi:hypothetical protein